MLKTAIYGLGNWGQKLIEAVHKKSDKIQIVQMVTRDTSKYGDLVAKTGIAISNNYESILQSPDIEAVIIATGHSVHSQHVEQAAAAGKHVFCEKPFTLTKKSAIAAAKACEDAGVRLAVAFNRRFQPALIRIKEMIENGALGTVLHVEGAHSGHAGYDQLEGWRSTREENPAGVMCGKGVHVLDLMIMAAGPAAHISASQKLVFLTVTEMTALASISGLKVGRLDTFLALPLPQTIGDFMWQDPRDGRKCVTKPL